MLDRSQCPHFLFGGCQGDGCDRPCSATIYIPADKTPLGRQMLRTSHLTLWAVLAALIPAFIFAASVGLARAERAHEEDIR